jgi:Peptidyl-tRNA hydrolase PTH2
LNLHKTLEEAGIIHKLWMEQPENIPTALALKPYEKETVQDFFKTLKLMR